MNTWKYDAESEIIGRPATSFWQSPRGATRIISTHRQGWIGELQAKRKTFDIPGPAIVNHITDTNNRPGHVVAPLLTCLQSAVLFLKRQNQRRRIPDPPDLKPDATNKAGRLPVWQPSRRSSKTTETPQNIWSSVAEKANRNSCLIRECRRLYSPRQSMNTEQAGLGTINGLSPEPSIEEEKKQAG
jgi:hypothetical protein